MLHLKISELNVIFLVEATMEWMLVITDFFLIWFLYSADFSSVTVHSEFVLMCSCARQTLLGSFGELVWYFQCWHQSQPIHEFTLLVTDSGKVRAGHLN